MWDGQPIYLIKKSDCSIINWYLEYIVLPSPCCSLLYKGKDPVRINLDRGK